MEHYVNLLNEFTQEAKNLFADNLVGVYLHGSAAMGCFHPALSDLDLIVVIEHDAGSGVMMKFMKEVVRLNADAPKKGIEMSVVKRKYCNPFVYPTPFDMHFSNAHLKWFTDAPDEYIAKMNGTDKDLAAHFTIIRKYGRALCGAPAGEVFGEVPREAYIDSICLDVKGAKEEIAREPLYMILNLCRVLAYLQEGLVLSKEAGGEWGAERLSARYTDLIRKALDCYRSGRPMECVPGCAEEFAGDMIRQIGALTPERR